jgi:hypothetical protein
MITRLEESYRLWYVWVWSWSLDSEEALAYWVLLRRGKKYASGVVRSSMGTETVPGGGNLQQPFLVRTAASSTAENVTQRNYRVKLYSATNRHNVA